MTKEQLIEDMNMGIAWKKDQMNTELKMLVKDLEYSIETLKSSIEKNTADASLTDLNLLLMSAQTTIEHIKILKNELEIRKVTLDAVESLD